jgi:hypothetical protein
MEGPSGNLAESLALDVSAASVTVLSTQSAGRLQELAADIALRSLDVAAVVNRRALDAVPELVDPEDPTSREALWHSSQANVGAILSMLAYGVPGASIQPPAGALELFERLADREDGLTIILRAYRVGMAELWQIWARHVADGARDQQEMYEVLAASTSHLMAYIARMSEQLMDLWAETRRRRQRGLDVTPEDVIRHALFNHGDDGRALTSLGYDVGRAHVALALPSDIDERHVEQLSSRLCVEARAQTVVMRHDDGWVVWLGLDDRPDDGSLETIEAAVAVAAAGAVGLGGAGAGLEGFRAAYREALDARRVGVLRHADGVTRYGEVALLAVLCADTDRARALARSELGPLVARDEPTCRLRDTLAAYLACGESHVAAAKQLYVHQKTVAYRVRHAEELLGRRVGERRAELEAALLLYRAFDGEV